MNRFFTSKNDIDITGATIALTGTNAKHACGVLRLAPGERCVVCDGEMNDYLCVVESASVKTLDLKIIGASQNQNEPAHKIYLFQGLPKSDKMEQIIQKSVELGVSGIYPVETARSIVRRFNVGADKLERWMKISEAAAMQSHRGTVPIVHSPLTIGGAIDEIKRINPTLALCAYENEKKRGIKYYLRNASIEPGEAACVFIGPEGGFSEDEMDVFEQNGIFSASLGGRILRCETAGPAALAIIIYELEG